MAQQRDAVSATETPRPGATATPTRARPDPSATVIAPDGLRRPNALVLDNDNGLLWVVSRDSGEVYAVSLADRQTAGRVGVGELPFGADVLSGIVYVANFATGSLSRIDAVTHSRLPDLLPGAEPSWVAADPVTGRVWVALHAGGHVAIVSGDDVWRTIETGRGAFAVAVDSVRRAVYVGNRDSKDVIVLNADSGERVRTLDPGGSPFALAVNEASGMLYVVHGAAGGGCPANRLAIYAADGMKLRDIGLGDTCDGGWAAVNSANGRVYAAAAATGQVWAFEWDGALHAVFGPAHGVGREPLGLAVDPARSLIYVGNHADDTVTVLYDP